MRGLQAQRFACDPVAPFGTRDEIPVLLRLVTPHRYGRQIAPPIQFNDEDVVAETAEHILPKQQNLDASDHQSGRQYRCEKRSVSSRAGQQVEVRYRSAFYDRADARKIRGLFNRLAPPLCRFVANLHSGLSR